MYCPLHNVSDACISYLYIQGHVGASSSSCTNKHSYLLQIFEGGMNTHTSFAKYLNEENLIKTLIDFKIFFYCKLIVGNDKLPIVKLHVYQVSSEFLNFI